MSKVLFFDTETTNDGNHLKDIGAIAEDGSTIHTPNRNSFVSFAKDYEFLCGHNIFAHDLKYLESDLERTGTSFRFIDTLYLSPLLFPSRPYHHLLKDDKLQTNELNNPVNDSIKAKDLFFDEISAFKSVFCKSKFRNFADKNGESCISVLEKIADCPAALPRHCRNSTADMLLR